MTKKKVLLIDANNMFFRAYTANPSLNLNGLHIGAITGFFYSLQRSVKDVRPHKIVVIWDGKGGSKKRQELVSDYKHGRKPPRPLRLNRALDIQKTEEEETDSRLFQQGRIIEYLNHLPILQLCETGVEADDLISYVNNYYDCSNYIKVIVSNDKDFLQLLDNCTILYRPTKQEFITYKSVVQEFGIHPQNMALARSIDGDNSDNLEGIDGVGLKTVAKLFPEFADETTIDFQRLEELCEKIKSGRKNTKKTRKSADPEVSILENMEKVKNNYKVMQLYSPLVPMDTKFRVDQQISSFEMNISFDNFLAEFKKDGILATSFVEIAKHCDLMIKENSK